MKLEGFCFDVEGDGFYLESTKAWCVYLKDLHNPETNRLAVFPFKDVNARQKVIEWIDQYDVPVITGHYMLGYDIFMMFKYLDIEFSVGPDTFAGKQCHYIDTFFLSMYTNPDRQGHSIESYGETLGLAKIDWKEKAVELGLIEANAPKGAEFKQWHPDMGRYCSRDVDVNIKAFWYLWSEFWKMYGEWKGEMPEHYRISQKSFYLMSCQEFTGWVFDKEAAIPLVERIKGMMQEIEENVLPQLPPRRLKKGEQKEYTMPAKPFKKDGSLSAHMLNFIEKHSGQQIDGLVYEFYGKQYTLQSQLLLAVEKPMLLGNQDDLKEWLLEKGWVPTLYNYKRGPDGKPERDPKTRELIKTTPKLQETGKICINLEALDGDLVKQVVKWLSLRNRLSVLEGWLEHPRLSYDGRLPSTRTGITPTFRQKHSVITNLPKASDKVLLGKEFRSLFIVPKEKVLVSVDQSGLEARCKANRTWKYDAGVTAKEILEGDPHSKNAKIFYPSETEAFDINAEDFDKDNSIFKPFRDRSKNGGYALDYGCSPKKLAAVLGKPESAAEKLYEAFWENNPALKAFKDNLTRFWEEVGGKKWILGIDKRRIVTRKKSALVNSCLQSDGALSMDYAICMIDKQLGGIQFDEDCKPLYRYKGYEIRRIGYMHDQLDFESPEDIAEDIKELVSKAYSKAGEYLKFKVPLQGDGKIGKNLKEVH